MSTWLLAVVSVAPVVMDSEGLTRSKPWITGPETTRVVRVAMKKSRQTTLTATSDMNTAQRRCDGSKKTGAESFVSALENVTRDIRNPSIYPANAGEKYFRDWVPRSQANSWSCRWRFDFDKNQIFMPASKKQELTIS